MDIIRDKKDNVKSLRDDPFLPAAGDYCRAIRGCPPSTPEIDFLGWLACDGLAMANDSNQSSPSDRDAMSTVGSCARVPLKLKDTLGASPEPVGGRAGYADWRFSIRALAASFSAISWQALRCGTSAKENRRLLTTNPGPRAPDAAVGPPRPRRSDRKCRVAELRRRTVLRHGQQSRSCLQRRDFLGLCLGQLGWSLFSTMLKA